VFEEDIPVRFQVLTITNDKNAEFWDVFLHVMTSRKLAKKDGVELPVSVVP
jgi:hypothetical protein